MEISLQAIFLLVLTIVILVTNKIFTKKLVHDVNPLALTFLANFFSVFLLLPFSWQYFVDFSSWTPHIFFLLLSGAAWTLAGIVSTFSVQKGDVSLRESLIALRVIWVVIFGYLFLGEFLTTGKVASVLLIFSGIVLAGINFRKISSKSISDGGAVWALGSSFFTAIAAVIDKIGSGLMPPVLYSLFTFLIPTIFQSYVGISLFSECKQILKKHLLKFTIIATTQASYFYLMIKIFSLLPITIAYPILQSVSIFTVLAAMVFLGERENIRNRILGSAVVLVGIICLKLI